MATLLPGQTKKYVFVNSRDRQSGTSGSFNYRITDTRIDRPSSFYVEKVLIPYSFYNISSALQNNKITIIEQTGSLQFTITLPDGQYTFDDFADRLAYYLTFESALSGNSYTYTVSQQANYIPKIRIAISDPTKTFKILWATGTTTYMWRLLGYNQADSVSWLYQQDAQNVFNFNIAPNILVRSKKLTASNNSVHKSKVSDIILSAPMAAFQETLIYEPSNFALYEFTSGTTSLNEFDLYLTFDDDNNTNIDMNNVDWTAVIVFIQDSYV